MMKNYGCFIDRLSQFIKSGHSLYLTINYCYKSYKYFTLSSDLK